MSTGLKRRLRWLPNAITIARLVHPGSRYRLTGEFAP